jgi:threonine 3-dehydrogenase
MGCSEWPPDLRSLEKLSEKRFYYQVKEANSQPQRLPAYLTKCGCCLKERSAEMAKLITGGTGYIGAELAHILVERGEEVVLFDIVISEYRIEDIKNKVKIVRGDLGNFAEVANVVKENGITEIYHMGGLLTMVSDGNPWASFRVNVIGTYNVLEAARLFSVNKMMFASSIGTYGLGITEVIDDLTIQRPTNFYGVGKLYCEGLGRWYMNKFGLDFRSIRYPATVGPNVRTPGHWMPPMIEDSIFGRPHECLYAPADDPGMPLIYLTDAARAADMVLQAPKGQIKMINYCVSGVSDAVSVNNMETILRKRYPKTSISYRNPLGEIRVGVVKRFDDTYARNEWHWKPLYTTPEAVVEKFERDMKEHPTRFGLE